MSSKNRSFQDAGRRVSVPTSCMNSANGSVRRGIGGRIGSGRTARVDVRSADAGINARPPGRWRGIEQRLA